MIYLIEPYNAYQKPPKKKHWMEIVEEETLFHRIVAEQSALQQNQNLALISQKPQPSSQQVQDAIVGPPVNAGAGGTPLLPSFFISQSEQSETANFFYTPSSGIGPLTVTFLNLTPTPANDTFYWNFGSGSLTSTAINPTALMYTYTGSYTVQLQSTSSVGTATITSSIVTVILPTVVSNFTVNTASGTAPLNVTFSNASSTNGIGTLNYFWDFGSGSKTSTALNPTMSYKNPGVYNVSLQVTESYYGVSTETTKNSFISASA